MRKLLFVLLLVFCKQENLLFENSLASKEEVIQKAFDSISSNDLDSLEKLLLTREEHNLHFWKHVGERFQNDPGMSANDAYNFMRLETDLALKQLQDLFQNKKFSIRNIQCERKEYYGPYTLHMGCTFLYGLGDSNRQIRTVIELRGRFKLYHLRRD